MGFVGVVGGDKERKGEGREAGYEGEEGGGVSQDKSRLYSLQRVIGQLCYEDPICPHTALKLQAWFQASRPAVGGSHLRVPSRDSICDH